MLQHSNGEVMGDDGSAEGRAAAFVFDGEICGHQDGDDYFTERCAAASVCEGGNSGYHDGDDYFTERCAAASVYEGGNSGNDQFVEVSFGHLPIFLRVPGFVVGQSPFHLTLLMQLGSSSSLAGGLQLRTIPVGRGGSPPRTILEPVPLPPD